MSEIKPVSSYEPVYQSQTDGVWHDVRKADFDARSHCPDLFKQRILYHAAAYEALQKENESLRKQVEELSQPIPDWKIELLFNRAMDYKELRISEAAYDKAVREILSASKNGE